MPTFMKPSSIASEVHPELTANEADNPEWYAEHNYLNPEVKSFDLYQVEDFMAGREISTANLRLLAKGCQQLLQELRGV